MRYYIKSKLFKLKEDFWIKNDREEDAFFVDNKLISVGLQFKMMKDNKTLYEVKQKTSITAEVWSYGKLRSRSNFK